jgi:hypothetical protein
MSTRHDRQQAAGTAAAASAARLVGHRVLYVTHRMPYPPHGGARVRAYHCVRHLARHNAVTVAAPVRDAADATAARALAQVDGVRVLSAPIGRGRALAQALWCAARGRPASMGHFDAPGLSAAIRDAHADAPFNLAIVHSSAVAPYVDALDGPMKVLDFVDMDSCKWRDYAAVAGFPRRVVYAREGTSLRRAEAELAARFDLCLTATEHEAASLREIAGDVPHAVVRNGVDLDYYTPGDGDYDPDTICFVGRMDYLPNVRAMVRFCRDVWPRVRAHRPDGRLLIVGAAPTRAVRALSRVPGVTVTGGVPDVRPYVRRAAATVVPLDIARGTQNKILESMAMGVPVIASTVAARGVDAVPGTHLLTVCSETAMVMRIGDVLAAPATRSGLATAARAWVREHASWETTLTMFDSDLAVAVGPGRERDALGGHG